jgi:predicted thioredoxin/glutaredoxin
MERAHAGTQCLPQVCIKAFIPHLFRIVIDSKAAKTSLLLCRKFKKFKKASFFILVTHVQLDACMLAFQF